MPLAGLLATVHDMGTGTIPSIALDHISAWLEGPDAIDELAMHMQVTNTGRARTKSRPISGTDTLARKLPDIIAPIAGIWGALDATAIPRIDMRRDMLRRVQPDAEFHVIPKAGHWVMYEATDAFVETLTGILSRVEERD